VILVDDLGQLPPIKDKDFYASETIGKVLWKSFNIVVTLDKKIQQQGTKMKQSSFCNILTNISNAKPFLHYSYLIISCVDNYLCPMEKSLFH